AGPTGVELAGQLSLLVHRTLPRELPSLDLGRARVVLVNAGDTVLESFPDRLRDYAAGKLEGMGIELRLGQVVDFVEHGVVRFGDGSELGASTVVWAAGVRACDLAGSLAAPVARGGRVIVTPTLNLESHPEVFVVGDMAYLEGYNGGGAYPMVAQVAMQQGHRAAENITALESGRELGEFHYFDKGQMAIIGRRAAVVDAFGLRLRALPAWLGWLALHILYLRGLRNRLLVLLDLIAHYVSPTGGSGVITRPMPAARVPELDADLDEAAESLAA